MIRIGVVGTGNMGRKHARVLSEMPEVDLVGVHDLDADRANAVARQYGCRHFFGLDALLDQVHAVVVATPTASHFDVGRRCIEAGRATLIEKPLASSVAEAKALHSASAQGPLVMVGYVERFNPVIRRLRELLVHDQPRSLHFTRVGPSPAGNVSTGVIMDLAIHDLDLMLYLSGRTVTRHAAAAAGPGREETASLCFQLGDDCHADITANWLAPFRERTVEVITPQSAYRCDLLTQRLTLYKRHYESLNTYTATEILVPYEEPLRAELSAFLRAVSRGETEPVPLRDALESLRLAEICLNQVRGNLIRAAQ